MALINLTARSRNYTNITSIAYGFQSDRISDVIVIQTSIPALNGVSEFSYLNLEGVTEHWTVDQTVAQIIAAASSMAITGTNSETFGIDVDATTYVLIKNNAGTLQVRNQADGAYAPLQFAGAASAATVILGAGERLYIDAITTDHTGATCVFVDVDVNSAAVDAYSANLDINTALSSAEFAVGYRSKIDGLTGNADTSALVGFMSTVTEPTGGCADVIGFYSVTDGVASGADTTNGFYALATDTLGATSTYYAFKANMVGLTGTGTAYGVFVDSTGTTLAGTSTAINIDGTWTNGIDLTGSTITTDITLSNGGKIHNTSSSIMTFTEAGFNFVGNVTVNGTINYILDNSAGGNDTYTATMAPALSAYGKGQLFTFYPLTNNTGACTLDINGLGAKNIKTSAGADPSNDDIIAAMPTLLSYDGTKFIICNPY